MTNTAGTRIVGQSFKY